eukprot:scaffold3068_cov401-Prasinococcus_capsulatus_cf.AAC.55
MGFLHSTKYCFHVGDRLARHPQLAISDVNVRMTVRALRHQSQLSDCLRKAQSIPMLIRRATVYAPGRRVHIEEHRVVVRGRPTAPSPEHAAEGLHLARLVLVCGIHEASVGCSDDSERGQGRIFWQQAADERAWHSPSLRCEPHHISADPASSQAQRVPLCSRS